MKLIQKNRTKTDCGVVAAFNAASLCKVQKPYKVVAKVAASCGYREGLGLYHFQFSELLKKLSVPSKRIKHKSLEHMESDLRKGKIFVIFYLVSESETGHIVMSLLDHEGRIRLINPESHRMTWRALATEIKENGMKQFHTYEISTRLGPKP